MATYQVPAARVKESNATSSLAGSAERGTVWTTARSFADAPTRSEASVVPRPQLSIAPVTVVRQLLVAIPSVSEKRVEASTTKELVSDQPVCGVGALLTALKA